MNHLDPDTLHFILESAILAPSADNQHRVQFGFDATQNTLRITTEGPLPPLGGYKRALALMSLGALVENLAIAASRFGIKVATTLYPDPNQPTCVLQIHLLLNQAEANPLWPTIPLRHTNRRVFFHGAKMSSTERGELDAAAHASPDCQLHWLDGSEIRNEVLRLMRRAETERFRTQALHEELFSAIRFEAGWHASCPEGLPPGALGVEPPLRPVFSLLRHWPVMRLVNMLGTHYLMGWRACDLPCRLAPHLGLLSIRNTDDQSVFDVGRSFQRIWLTVTLQGRVLQPMPASAIFALDGAGTEGVPVELQRALKEGWNASLGEAIPLMLFRIGFARPSSIVAGRPSVGANLNTAA